ncbi:carbohydrate esterase family 15 protein [Calocera viscosa TUFC12733]|uniref:(4-O-methyl)-D-glucuronate--lignin esterase n=1 Tax=Calocera viscosa (strain TUFC12733) TaxID=1330018 RepID=A0A167Q6Q2_CALVF|nr:carbohydrate esterase family 15 protein [Calocera viscosa TUFC12733]
MTVLRLSLASLLLLASSALALPASGAQTERGLVCDAPTYVPYNDARLPNPFVFDNGAPVQSFADWDCRRSQIASLIQGYEAGALPGRPEIVSSTLVKAGYNANFTVTAGFQGNTITWTNTVTYPNTTVPKAGWPLVIAYDGLSIPLPPGIAVLTYPNSLIAEQNSSPASRGVGLFFDLYGNVSASSMTAWVWGVSRVIDALEENDSANFNLAKIAVTGCSRDGKGALMAGAFEPRIALTIPQESGSGGDTCWRLSKYEQDSGDDVQQATEIVQENVWFSTNFDNYVYNISELPYDHHFLAGLVAPRGLLSYENTDVEWLSPLSAYGCMTAAHTIYQAMGIPDYHGFVQVGNHSHCAFPAYLEDSLFAFIDKFLLDEPNTNTNYFSTNGVFNGTVWDPSYWINWATPSFW